MSAWSSSARPGGHVGPCAHQVEVRGRFHSPEALSVSRTSSRAAPTHPTPARRGPARSRRRV